MMLEVEPDSREYARFELRLKSDLPIAAPKVAFALDVENLTWSEWLDGVWLGEEFNLKEFNCREFGVLVAGPDAEPESAHQMDAGSHRSKVQFASGEELIVEETDYVLVK